MKNVTNNYSKYISMSFSRTIPYWFITETGSRHPEKVHMNQFNDLIWKKIKHENKYKVTTCNYA